MITDSYLNTSRVMRSLSEGPFGNHIHLYVERLRQGGYCLVTGHRYLSLARDFGFWLVASGFGLADVREALVSQYLAERSRHRPRRRGDALALARLLAVLRERTSLRLDRRHRVIRARIFFGPTASTWSASAASRRPRSPAVSGSCVRS